MQEEQFLLHSMQEEQFLLHNMQEEQCGVRWRPDQRDSEAHNLEDESGGQRKETESEERTEARLGEAGSDQRGGGAPA